MEGPPGLRARAGRRPATELVAWAVRWTVQGRLHPGASSHDMHTVNPMLPLPAGRYVVEARRASAMASPDGRCRRHGTDTAAAVPLNAGALLVAGRRSAEDAGTPLADAVTRHQRCGPECGRQAGAGALVAVFKGGEGRASADLRPLPWCASGSGLVARTERAVAGTGPAAGRSHRTLAQWRTRGADGAGARRGGRASSCRCSASPRMIPMHRKGGARWLRSAARQAEFSLPPGTYYVIARLGGVETRELLALTPGDTVRRTLTLAAGRLALSTRLSGGVAPAAGMSSPIASSAWTDRSGMSSPPAGRVRSCNCRTAAHRVEGRYGLMNARSVRDVEVRAPGMVSSSYGASGRSAEAALTGGATPFSDVFWDVRDETGRYVWTTGQSEPRR